MTGPVLPGETLTPPAGMPLRWRFHRIQQQAAALRSEADELLPSLPGGSVEEDLLFTLSADLGHFEAWSASIREPEIPTVEELLAAWVAPRPDRRAIIARVVVALELLPRDDARAVPLAHFLQMTRRR